MKRPVSDVAFTSRVKSVQERLGSRSLYEKAEERGGWSDTITDELADFISIRDSFYLGTASADGKHITVRGTWEGPLGTFRTRYVYTFKSAGRFTLEGYSTHGETEVKEMEITYTRKP